MRDFTSVKRVVVKAGTNLLSSTSGVDKARIQAIVSQVAALKNQGKQVLLVSSGSVALGAKAIKRKEKVSYTALKQACAAIGQPLLMNAYSEEFSKHGLLCAQILITRAVLNNRTSYNNLRTSVSMLLGMGVVPVFNENDVISATGVKALDVFGDNDRLSAMIASKIDADLLVLLTDIDALYTGDPKKDPEAYRLVNIPTITPEVMGYAKGAGSAFSTGGMRTKLLAAQIAQQGGCATVICSGFEDRVLERVLNGEELGTCIYPAERIAARERWMLNTEPSGTIVVDRGAKKALEAHKSLLPSGVKAVIGSFDKGEIVSVQEEGGAVFAKAAPYFDSTDLERILGHKSSEIDSILGQGRKDVVFRPEDMVELEDE